VSSERGSIPAGHLNRLADAASPYLLQHASNPVDWMEWGEEAFARARAENKPVLLSVGYAACHWCHVMAHESFENPDIAAIQNELFVSIKVDREERPDIDAIYMNALHLLGQQGGWPLTMFLTAAGEPFWGGTYFPPEGKWGRPGFPEVLRGVAAVYANEPDKVRGNAVALQQGLERASATNPGDGVSPEMLDRVASALLRHFDPVHGGFGSAPKFPNAPVFALILRAWLRTGDTLYETAIRTTLSHICQGGIYDHAGGGFARYSTDAMWLAPHFEKMLYDNAQLVALLTLAWQATGEALYETRIRETVAWMMREMLAPDGGFTAALDADSEGEEGKFYVWDKAEIDRLLGADAAFFNRVYDVTEGGNWEGKTILHRNHAHGAILGDADEARLTGLRARLLAARDSRVRPGWDDKVLADWNGLAIGALAEAGFVFGEAEWVRAAERAFAAVTAREKDGRLAHAWRGARVSAGGLLEDYALMADGALTLYEVTGKGEYLAAAERWAATLEAHFRDAEGGGYFHGPDDGETLIVRAKSAADNAVPSGNGAMAGVLTRLALATGDGAYADRAEALIKAMSGDAERNYFSLATLLNGAELAFGATQIVIVGDRAAPDTQMLLEVVRTSATPNRWLAVIAPGVELPPGHPAAAKGQIGGVATAYVCHGQTCSAPVTDAAALRALLQLNRPQAQRVDRS
jgi:uncharacterized protein YyaL (SSP411 family)